MENTNTFEGKGWRGLGVPAGRTGYDAALKQEGISLELLYPHMFNMVHALLGRQQRGEREVHTRYVIFYTMSRINNTNLQIGKMGVKDKLDGDDKV